MSGLELQGPDERRSSGMDADYSDQIGDDGFPVDPKHPWYVGPWHSARYPQAPTGRARGAS